MLSFGKKEADGRFYSECRQYFTQRVGDVEGKNWTGYKVTSTGGFAPVTGGIGVDWEEARWACENDKYRYPCGCVLTIRPNWWRHCPKCGARLPEPKPYVPPPPKPVRKVKAPNRPEWLVQRTRGTEKGHEWDCVYEGKKWALVRVPGYTGWVSVGATAYHPTTYEIMRTESVRGRAVTYAETKGLTSLLKVKRFAHEPDQYSSLDVHEGRATKEDLVRLKAMVDELDREGV